MRLSSQQGDFFPVVIQHSAWCEAGLEGRRRAVLPCKKGKGASTDTSWVKHRSTDGSQKQPTKGRHERVVVEAERHIVLLLRCQEQVSPHPPTAASQSSRAHRFGGFPSRWWPWWWPWPLSSVAHGSFPSGLGGAVG